MKCQICKRSIYSAESLMLGIGPECADRYSAGVAAAGTSVERIEALTDLNDEQVSRWLRCAKLAIGAKRIDDARRFLLCAEDAAAANLAERF